MTEEAGIPLSGNDIMECVLRPRRIAIVGASRNPEKIGSLPLRFLRKHGYQGEIFVVHPEASEIGGVPCYPSIAALPNPIDLMVVTLPAAQVPEVIATCAPGQVAAALIISSGFAETGGEGRVRQSRLCELAQERGMHLVGPNSVGVVNLWDGVSPSISQVFDHGEFHPGPVALVTQSGAMGTAITALAHDLGINVGYFISTGNEADIDFTDFCLAVLEDPRITTIGGYLEGVRDGAKFYAVARRALRDGKALILVKVGRSTAGQRAAESHTAALTGSDAAYDVAFRENGVIRAATIENLLDYVKIFSAYPGTRSPVGVNSKRIALLSHSGGNGVLMADACVERGALLPAPSQNLHRRLAELLPDYASLCNPIDLTANVVFNPKVIAQAAEHILASGEYDAVILSVNLMYRAGPTLVDCLIQLRTRYESILAVAWVGGDPALMARLTQGSLPVFSDPVRAVDAVTVRLEWARQREKLLRVPAEPRAPVVTGRTQSDPLNWSDQQKLLQRYSLPLLPAALVTTWDEARGAAAEIGYPVVAKVIGRGLWHKSEQGGVITGIRDETLLRHAWQRLATLPVKEREGILIQKMVEGALELFAGCHWDSVFGPIVAFGLGGLYVELMPGAVRAMAPLTFTKARQLVESSRWYPVLAGYRARPAVPIAPLAELLMNMSELVVREGVAELDLNPIFASSTGICIGDAKLRFGGKLQ